jgi:8-oxo-dGTP pyrophosphatase MutT (NUDIX family)
VEIASRPAVRIICLDADARVLLLCWQDPFDGSRLWEPPGGGIEPGETPYEAACRELAEETGLDPTAIVDQPVVVDRDTVWNGRRFIGPEPFFVARFTQHEPLLSRLGLIADEHQNQRGHRWLHQSDVATLDGRLEPPTLARVVARFDASWSE